MMKPLCKALTGLLLFISLLPYTVSAKIVVVGDLSHEYTVANGEVYSGSVHVKNLGDSVSEFRIYQTDYAFFCDGRNLYGEPGQMPRSNASWIQCSPKRSQVLPGQEVIIHYSIHIPQSIAIFGSYWSMLMIEEVKDVSPESVKNRPSVGISMVMRYGVQIVTHIGASGQKQLKFVDTRVQRNEGKRRLEVDIENVGERLLKPAVWLELYDAQGQKVRQFEEMQKRTYPGTSIRYAVDLNDLSIGSYKALVVADCGGDDIFAAQYTLKIE